MSVEADVIVVGGGNAALCAALAAREDGARVVVLERAPEAERGGNSFFTGGVVRFPHHGVDDIVTLFPELGDAGAEIDLEPYTEGDFFDDMARMTAYRADPELVSALTSGARDALHWMHGHGVRFLWSLGRHAHRVDGRYRFFGGAPVTITGGGAGLMEALYRAVEQSGVEVLYATRATDLISDEAGGLTGVRAHTAAGRTTEIKAPAVVLASGGFEANSEMRARYLGKNWDLARVRGTQFNTGDGIEMGLRFGAKSFGHWSGCHATAWDANAPLTGDRRVGDEFSRHSYPLGIVVNKNSERFVDEGADFHTHTYAAYGAEVLRQPALLAYQIFDAKVEEFLRGDYRGRHVSKATADTIEELAVKLELDPVRLRATVDAFNAAVDQTTPFNPNVKDGKAAAGITPVKSNWAVPLDTPPYRGFPVTAGITFTFGGLRVDEHSRVLDDGENVIPGLFAAGELVGGLFYFNYPSGTGLVSGAVFGRAAGAGAAAAAKLR